MKYEYLGNKKLVKQDLLFKLIIIGDSGVGKSCLMMRVVDDRFKNDHEVTIGVEFGSFGMQVNEKIIKMQIWDTVSQKLINNGAFLFLVQIL